MPKNTKKKTPTTPKTKKPPKTNKPTTVWTEEQCQLLDDAFLEGGEPAARKVLPSKSSREIIAMASERNLIVAKGERDLERNAEIKRKRKIAKQINALYDLLTPAVDREQFVDICMGTLEPGAF